MKWPFPYIWNTSSHGVKNEYGFEVDATLSFNVPIHEIPASVIHFNLEKNRIYSGRIDDYESDAIALFLQEKIINIKEERPNRQFRKISKKVGLDDTEKVHILVLRDIDYGNGKVETNNEEKREYYHRWLVRGHIRHQWHPSTKTHEVIWIDPYVKGPEDKPFRETVRYLAR